MTPSLAPPCKRAFQRADGRGDRGIHVAQRGNGDAGAEGRGVHPVIGMKDVAQIQRAFLFCGRFFAVDHVKKIGGFAELWIGLQ